MPLCALGTRPMPQDREVSPSRADVEQAARIRAALCRARGLALSSGCRLPPPAGRVAGVPRPPVLAAAPGGVFFQGGGA